MQYLVIAPDGQKYGPADVNTLAEWGREGRITPQTLLESMTDGSRIAAGSVPGIFQNAQASYQPPQQFAQYQRTYQAGPVPNSGNDITMAFVFGGISILCCPIVFGPLAISYALKAQRAGHPTAQAALIFAIIAMLLGFGIGALTYFSTLQRRF